MKNLFLLLSVLFAGIISAQNNVHPTINNVKVIYKATPAATVITSGKYQVNVQPQVTVILKSTDNVSKIYLEILKQDSSTVVYQSNYNINSAAVIQNNIKLFERTDKTIFISCPQNVPRETYIYKIYTENGNNIASANYYIKL